MIGPVVKMWRSVTSGARRPFLITPDKTFSYSDLHSAVRAWLALFDEAGLQSGDRLVIRSDNEFAVISCFVAALLDGKVPVNLADDTPHARFAAIVSSTDARCVVDDHAKPSSAPAHWPFHHQLAETPAVRPKAGLFRRRNGDQSPVHAGIPAMQSQREPVLEEDGADLAYILFTSGTTSAPSGVMIQRQSLFANLATLTRLFEYGKNSRIFNDMALAHADGMVQGPILALANQAAVIRAGGFSLSGLEKWLMQVRASRATHVIMVPTIWSMIDSYAEHGDYFDAPECRSLQSVAAKLPLELWERLEKRFALPLANHYGLTETVASAIYSGPHSEMGPIGTLGVPIDCEARIDPAATSTAGDEGELQLRGANIFSGYWKDEKRSRASFTDDGWLRTGDLARQNPDGSYSITGRIKNIIMSGGFLIRPEEIDETMLSHPQICESVTVALPDEVFGEIPATAVVLYADDALSTEGLTEHARSSLEARKVPKRFLILESIPRGISGKPKLQELASLFGTEPAGSSAASDAQTDLLGSVLELAASIFRVPAEDLSAATHPGDLKGWDSFSHVALILEAEAQFSVRLPASKVAKIASIRDLCDAIEEQV